MNMQIPLHTLLAILLLAGGYCAQLQMLRHLGGVEAAPAVALACPLESLPKELGDWHGTDLPITDERMRYGDQHLQRAYQHADGNQTLSLWCVYSGQGNDRSHHPEVCMAVHGLPEDVQARTTFDIDAQTAPVRQYRFGAPGRGCHVFYWHYTLEPPRDESLDAMQRLYQRFRSRPSSITLTVYAWEHSAEDLSSVQSFVRLVDAAMQSHVGPGAIRGSNRLPVVLR